MIRDFLFSGHYTRPWAFAREYYLHFPRVVIGHWPPLMYVSGGLWLALFGASRTAAMLFIAATAAGSATLIYTLGSRLVSRRGGALAALLFLASPLVQASTAMYITEHLVTLFMLASAAMFGRFAKTGSTRDGVLFGLLAAAAILTRGSGWALGLMPVVAILLTRNFALLKRSGLWLGALPPLLAGVPWYYLTRSMMTGSWAGSPGDEPYWRVAVRAFGTDLYQSLGLAVSLLALAGFYVKILRPFAERAVAPEWAALAGLAIATLGLQCALPVGIEARYMVTVIPTVLLLAVAGLATLEAPVARFLPGVATRIGVSSLLPGS